MASRARRPPHSRRRLHARTVRCRPHRRHARSGCLRAHRRGSSPARCASAYHRRGKRTQWRRHTCANCVGPLGVPAHLRRLPPHVRLLHDPLDSRSLRERGPRCDRRRDTRARGARHARDRAHRAGHHLLRTRPAGLRNARRRRPRRHGRSRRGLAAADVRAARRRD